MYQRQNKLNSAHSRLIQKKDQIITPFDRHFFYHQLHSRYFLNSNRHDSNMDTFTGEYASQRSSINYHRYRRLSNNEYARFLGSAAELFSNTLFLIHQLRICIPRSRLDIKELFSFLSSKKPSWIIFKIREIETRYTARFPCQPLSRNTRIKTILVHHILVKLPLSSSFSEPTR